MTSRPVSAAGDLLTPVPASCRRLRHRCLQRRPLLHRLVPGGERRATLAPVEIGPPEVEIAEDDRGGELAQRQRTVEPARLGFALDPVQRARDLRRLAVAPGRPAILLGPTQA